MHILDGICLRTVFFFFWFHNTAVHQSLPQLGNQPARLKVNQHRSLLGAACQESALSPSSDRQMDDKGWSGVSGCQWLELTETQWGRNVEPEPYVSSGGLLGHYLAFSAHRLHACMFNIYCIAGIFKKNLLHKKADVNKMLTVFT